MPAGKSKEAVAKRKSARGHSPAPSSKKKKRLIQDHCNHTAGNATTTGGASSAIVPRANKFVLGLAAQLASAGGDTDGSLDIEVGGAFRAALGALPKGKLKDELMRDEDATIKTLAAEVASIRAKQGRRQQQEQQNSKKQKQRGGEASVDKVGSIPTAAAPSASSVVPCTVQLYQRARAIAEKRSKGVGTSDGNEDNLLKALALSPRAPLDLLVDAMGSTKESSESGTETLDYAVVGLRVVAGALAVDPRAAMSPSGLAFFAHRVAVLASSVAKSVIKSAGRNSGGRGSDGVAVGDEAAAREALGLMLRALQVAGLAMTAAGSREAEDIDSSGGAQAASATDPGHWLLLPCSPETSSSSSGTAVMSAVSPSDNVGAPASIEVDSTPPARISLARVLAYYAVAIAACSVDRRKGPEAAAVIKSVRAAATGGTRRTNPQADEEDEGSSSSSSDDEEADKAHGQNNAILSRHLCALCAANLAGNEPATLEFLRCVGDSVFSADGGGGGGVCLSGSLSLVCARAIARLPQPAASPAPTAAQFLKRAYAFRVVDALNKLARAAAASSPLSVSAKEGATAVAITGLSCGDGSPSSSGARSGNRGFGSSGGGATWDFVGAARPPPALLQFLGRIEAPVAVGRDGVAGCALKALALRRDSPAAVAELLRSSPACAPAALGPLLSAMERLQGSTGEGAEVGGDKKSAAIAGGFFVDTGGAGARKGSEAEVLERLGSGTGVADMDEEEAQEVASVVSSTSSDNIGHE